MTGSTTDHVSGDGVYLYAVCRTDEPPDLTGVAGVRGNVVRLLEIEELMAVVSTVPLQEFGESGLRRNLEDLAWVESVARAHNAVVAGCAVSGAVAPVSLATVFLDDAAVVGALDGWGERVTEALDRVAGTREMGVKVFHRLATSAAHTPDTPAAPDGPGAGAAYLERLRSRATEREAAAEATARTAHELHARFGEHTVASRRYPLQDNRLTGHPGPMVLNAAYLVGDHDLDAFGDRVANLARAHTDLEVELTGPWPPYSFVTLEAP